MSNCARNLPQHFNGCVCTADPSITGEVDLDLTSVGPQRTSAKIGKGEFTGEGCRSCGTAYADCTAQMLGKIKGKDPVACCATCRYTGTHNEKKVDNPYDVGAGQSRQTDAPLDTLHLQTDNGVAREVARLADDGHLDLEPPYQRGSVWTLDQRIALVRSWAQGIPVPPVTVNDRTTSAWAENNGGVNPINTGDGMYGVVDGKQRIEAAQAWFNGEFAVPASWFPAEDVETTIDTPDGPYVTFDGMSSRGQTVMAFSAKLPRTTARMPSVEDEARLFLLLNGGGTQQTAESMDRAAHVASGRR